MILGDDLAFFDQDFLYGLEQDPNGALVDIDRELVARGGLRAFCELAWHTVEGSDATFRGNWHIDAICDLLEAVSRGKERRAAIAVPPRSMKSLLVSVFHPAWDWIDNPQRRFLFSSYAHNLSIRDSTRCRRVIQSPWYQARWGDRFTITSDQNTKVRFDNDRHGYRIATSVDGQLTGEGGDFVIVDDPHNVTEAESEATRNSTLAWWDEAMSTRLNSPTEGAFIIIQQRVHANDLIGHILKKAGRSRYHYLCLPARFEVNHPDRSPEDPRTVDGELLWPDRVPEAELRDLEMSLGPYAAAAQLQQRPAPREGGIFKRAWFPTISYRPPDLTKLSRAWDLAATEAKINKADPDYTATALIGYSHALGKFVIVEVRRWREEAHAVEQLILTKAQQDTVSVKQTIPQDPGQAGKAQGQRLLTLLAGWPASLEPQTGDKVSRAMPFAGQASGGNVVMVEGDWNDDFLAEITSFPNAAHDDQVDAIASAFTRMTGGSTGILDFYAQLAAQSASRKAEAMGPNRVIDDETTDFGKAIRLTGQLLR